MRAKNKTLLILFIGILLIGAFFRLNFLDLSRFEHEMVRDVVFAQKVVTGEIITHGVFMGLSDSVQTNFGPLSYYLTALGVLLAPSKYYYPLGPIAIIAIFDILAAIVTYKIGTEFFSRNVGWLAAALYLLSPWQIVNVATVLTPTNFLPLFIALFFYCLFKYILKNNEFYIIPALVFLGLALQFHLTPLLLFPALALAIIFFKRSAKLHYLLIAGICLLLTLAPFAYYSISTDNYLGATMGHLSARQGSTLARSAIESVGMPILYLAPYLGKFTLGSTIISENKLVESYFLGLTALITVLFLLGVAYLCRNNKYKNYASLLCLYSTPIAIYILKQSNVTPHYFLILLPLQMIILAIFLNVLLKRNAYLASAFIFILLLSNILFLTSFYNSVESAGGTTGIYGISYKYKMQAIEYIASSACAPELIYYASTKPLTQSMKYLFNLNYGAPHYRTINTISEFDTGFLIIDRYGFYGRYSGRAIPKSDYAIIDSMKPMRFGLLEVIQRCA